MDGFHAAAQPSDQDIASTCPIPGHVESWVPFGINRYDNTGD
jgi:hypothetical protein